METNKGREARRRRKRQREREQERERRITKIKITKERKWECIQKAHSNEAFLAQGSTFVILTIKVVLQPCSAGETQAEAKKEAKIKLDFGQSFRNLKQDVEEKFLIDT